MVTRHLPIDKARAWLRDFHNTAGTRRGRADRMRVYINQPLDCSYRVHVGIFGWSSEDHQVRTGLENTGAYCGQRVLLGGEC